MVHLHHKHHKHQVHPHHIHRKHHRRSVWWLLVLAGIFVFFLIGVSGYLPESWFSRAKVEDEFIGELQTVITEEFDHGTSQTKQFLKTKSERLEIVNTKRLLGRGGSIIKVKGKKNTSQTLELSAQPEIITESSVAATGAKKIAVILVDFPDVPSTYLTREQAALHINSDFRSYYLENSFNKLSLSGEAFGRFTLPINFTCDVWAIEVEAVKAADSVVDFSQYQGVMIAFPDNGYTCGFAGVSTIGPITLSSNDGSFSMLTTWYTDNSFSLRATGHEFAHGLGAYHANGWNCGPAMAGSCESVSYADPIDPMGIRGGGNHFNMYYKELFGWTTSSNIQMITRSGKYKISPLERQTTSPQVLKISRKDGTFYYIYQRSAFAGGFVSLAPIVLQSGDTHLVDATPNSASPEFTADFQDAGFAVGSIFSDPQLGLKVKAVSKINDIVMLDVTLPKK